MPRNTIFELFRYEFGLTARQIKSEELQKPQPPLLLKKYGNIPPICIAMPLLFVLQCPSYSHCNAPPICIAVHLQSYCSTFGAWSLRKGNASSTTLICVAGGPFSMAVPWATKTLPTRKNSTRCFWNYHYPIGFFPNYFWKITQYLLYLWCELRDITRLGPRALSNYFYYLYLISSFPN